MKPFSPSPLLLEIAAPGRLRAAWEKVQSRGNAAGIDRVSPADFHKDLDQQLAAIERELKEGAWRPLPGLRIALADDPDREIVIPTVRDRVVQRALLEALRPRLERDAPVHSYAYQAGRSPQDALRAAQRLLQGDAAWFVRTDIVRFFDLIPREPLLEALRAHQLPADVVALIERALKAGVLGGKVLFDPARGVSQGSPLSPLLSNLYLRPLDLAMERLEGVTLLRYADDLLLLAQEEALAVAGLDALAREAEALGLRLNPRKTLQGHVGAGFDFLGMRLGPQGVRFGADALKAVQARAEEVALRRSWAALGELGADWTRWYGPLRPEECRALPLLAAQLAAAPLPAPLAPWAAARMRLPAPPEELRWLQQPLLEVWANAPEPECLQATLTEARELLAADPALAPQVARALYLPPDAVQALTGPLEALPGALAARGQQRLAEAARRLRQRQRRAAAVATRQWLPEEIEALRLLFQGRSGEHAVEREDDRGHLRLLPQRQALAEEALEAHLRGDARRGLYPLREDSTVAVGLLEVLPRRAALLDGAQARDLEALAHQQALALRRAAQRRGLPMVLEDNGDGARRLWLLLRRAAPLAAVYRALQAVLADSPQEDQRLQVRHHPQNDHARVVPGPAVFLPLGRAPRTGRFSQLLDAQGLPVADPIAALEAAALPALALTSPEGDPQPLPAAVDAEGALMARVRELPAAWQVLRGCAVLRALATKARHLGILEANERASLFEGLGHLPGAEAEATLRCVLKASDAAAHRRIHRRLQELPPSPVSCPRLRQRHPALAAEVGCDCRFQRLAAGQFPTPLLHGPVDHHRPALATSAPPGHEPPPTQPMRARADAAMQADALKLRRLQEHLQGVRDSRDRLVKALEERMRALNLRRVRVEGGWLLWEPDRKPAIYFKEDER